LHIGCDHPGYPVDSQPITDDVRRSLVKDLA
jgi:hypothetical protein